MAILFLDASRCSVIWSLLLAILNCSCCECRARHGQMACDARFQAYHKKLWLSTKGAYPLTGSGSTNQRPRTKTQHSIPRLDKRVFLYPAPNMPVIRKLHAALKPLHTPSRNPPGDFCSGLDGQGSMCFLNFFLSLFGFIPKDGVAQNNMGSMSLACHNRNRRATAWIPTTSTAGVA